MAKNLATMLQSTTVSTELDAVSANKTSANFAKCSLTIMERLVNADQMTTRRFAKTFQLQ